MSDFKGTPGLFETVGNLVRTPLSDGGFLIADARDRNGEQHTEEAKANARLFAHAHTLYVLAKARLAELDFLKDDPTDAQRQERNELTAVVNRVEGR